MDTYDIVSEYMRRSMERDEILALYRASPDVNEKDEGDQGRTLLHIAAQYAHHEAVEYLLEAGADVNAENDYGKTALFSIAQRSGNFDKFAPGDVYKTALLLAKASKGGAQKKDDDGQAGYHIAARSGNGEFVKALLDAGVRLTAADKRDCTGLHLVCEYCYNAVKDLEKARERLAKARENGASDLDYFEKDVSAREQLLEGYFVAAKAFLDAGVDPADKNIMGETAHQLAVRNGAKKIAALLDGSLVPSEDGEVDPRQELVLKAGGMSLHQAVRQNDLEAIRAIVELGADLDEISDDGNMAGQTPLALACGVSKEPAVKLLLELGANPNFRTSDGRLPVAYMFTTNSDLHTKPAALKENMPPKILQELVAAGMDIDDGVDDESNTLLGLACKSQHGNAGYNRDTVKTLVIKETVRLGADVNKANLAGQTPLMGICAADMDEAGDIQMLLLDKGADVLAKDRAGNTPLHYAAQNPGKRRARDLSEMLFDYGDPDVNAVNNDGKTALDYATQRDNEALVKVLLGHL